MDILCLLILDVSRLLHEALQRVLVHNLLRSEVIDITFQLLLGQEIGVFVVCRLVDLEHAINK
jgi:uncharacterized membrane protein YGL010W